MPRSESGTDLSNGTREDRTSKPDVDQASFTTKIDLIQLWLKYIGISMFTLGFVLTYIRYFRWVYLVDKQPLIADFLYGLSISLVAIAGIALSMVLFSDRTSAWIAEQVRQIKDVIG